MITIPSKRLPFIFIGMPGAGKSFWARRLAGSWGGVALDLDAEIARISGKSIEEIFAGQGEAGFRKIEEEILRQVLADRRFSFLATGGGTPCFAHNLARIQAAGTVLYLEAPVAVLAQRIQAAETIRPLLRGLPQAALPEKLSRMLAEREPFYRQAHHTLSTEGLSEATFAAL